MRAANGHEMPPGAGSEDWHTYFRELKDGRNEAKDKIQADLRSHEILAPGHEVPVEEVAGVTKTGKISRTSAIGKAAVSAMASGWDVKAGLSRYYSGDKFVKSTGIVETGEERDFKWLEGRGPGGHFTLNEFGAHLNGEFMLATELVRRLEDNDE